MGFLSGILGTKSKYQATNEGLLSPVDQAAYSQAAGNANLGLDQQQAFLQALQAQGGIQNQANVFNQQQQLANQLGLMAQGQGPSVAQAQLNQATGANVANQAALMAGQRGAGANVGLLARQAGMQGANIQQQAGGQAAALRAQEQLNAISALQNQQAQMGNLAGSQVAQQSNALGNFNQFAQGNQNSLLTALNNQNANQMGLKQINADVANKNAQTNAGLVGGVLNAVGPIGSMIGGGAKAGAGAGLMAGGGDALGSLAPLVALASQGGLINGKAQMSGDHPQNDTVPAMLSPGEVVIPRSVMQSKNPAKGAKEFIDALLKKKSSSPKENFYSGGQALNELEDSSDFNPEAVDNPAPIVPAPEGQAPIAPAGPTTSEMMPQSPGMANPQSPMTGAMPSNDNSNVMMGANQVKTGIQQEAQAQAQAGQAEAQAAAKGAQDLQSSLNQFQTERARLDEQRQGLVDKFNSQGVDPNRYFHNMSTGQRIGTAIGLLLSGIGSGLSHQENLAAKFLDKQIDNDIAAQKADIGKTESLLSENLKQYGNLQDATNVTRAHLLEVSSLKIKEAALKSQDPVLQARAKQQIGELNMKVGALLDQTAARQTLLKQAQGSQDPTSLVPVMVPKEHQKEVFNEVKTAQNATRNEASLMKAFDDASKENTVLRTGAGMARTPAPVLQLKAMFLPIIHDAEGRVNEFEAKTLNDLIPQPGDRDSKIAYKKQALQDFINQKKSAPTAKGFGIDLEKFPSTSTNPETRLDPQQKQFANWARSNPNDPRAALVMKKLGLR